MLTEFDIDLIKGNQLGVNKALQYLSMVTDNLDNVDSSEAEYLKSLLNFAEQLIKEYNYNAVYFLDKTEETR